MFHRINEEKYLNLLTYTKGVYDKIIERDTIRTSHLRSYVKNNYNPVIRDEITATYENCKGQLNSKEEKILFQINLVITENNRFANCFYEYCQAYLRTEDINHIKICFFLRDKTRTTKWNMLIERLAKEFSVKKEVVIFKIGEILTYKNIYFPSLVEEKEEARKSLSSR